MREYSRQNKLVFEQYSQVVLAASLPAKEIYIKRGYVVKEAHSIPCNNGAFLYYDVMVKATNFGR